MSILKKIVKNIKASYQEKKDFSFKEKFRSEKFLHPIETEIFVFIKDCISEEKNAILQCVLSNINEIQRTNNMYLDEKTIQLKNERGLNHIFKNNYEVFMINSCSSGNKVLFSTLEKRQEFHWFKLVISYINGVDVEINGYIVDQDALFLEFDSDVIYPIENGSCDCEYEIKLIKINDF